jgi:hypothetical protein
VYVDPRTGRQSNESVWEILDDDIKALNTVKHFFIDKIEEYDQPQENVMVPMNMHLKEKEVKKPVKEKKEKKSNKKSQNADYLPETEEDVPAVEEEVSVPEVETEAAVPEDGANEESIKIDYEA